MERCYAESVVAEQYERLYDELGMRNEEWGMRNEECGMVVKTPLYCYVMEFRYGGTAEAALKQIEDKNYTLPSSWTDRKSSKSGSTSANAPKTLTNTL